MDGDRIAENLCDSLLPDTLAKMNKPAGIARKGVLEIGFSAKILHVGIHHPGSRQGLIAVVVEAFEQQAPDHKTNRHGGLTGMAVMPGKGFLKITPINAVGQNGQLLIGINKVSK